MRMTLFDTKKLADQMDLNLAAAYYEKDFTNEALTFISNSARTISYWGSNIDILPPGGKGKKRRYSLLDVIYLGIVKELREFGLEKDQIYNLKQALYAPIDVAANTEFISQNKAELESYLANHFGTNQSMVKDLLETYLASEQKLKALEFNVLGTYIFTVLARRIRINLLIDKSGKHFPYLEDQQELDLWNLNEEFVEFRRHSHLSISLVDVISSFVRPPSIPDGLKEKLFSDKEWKLIQLLRDRKPDYVEVTFKGEMDTVKITKQKKISIEARLSELLIKKGYENFEVVTADGKVIYVKSTESIRL